MTLKKDGGKYIITTRLGDTISVYRMAYAFKLLTRLARQKA